MFDSPSRLGFSGLLMAFGLWLSVLGVQAQGDVDLDEGVVSHNMEAVAFIPKADMLTEKVNDIASWYDEEEGITYLLVGCELSLIHI